MATDDFTTSTFDDRLAELKAALSCVHDVRRRYHRDDLMDFARDLLALNEAYAHFMREAIARIEDSPGPAKASCDDFEKTVLDAAGDFIPGPDQIEESWIESNRRWVSPTRSVVDNYGGW